MYDYDYDQLESDNHTWRNAALVAAFGLGAWAAYTLWRHPDYLRKARDKAREGYDKAKDLAQSGYEKAKDLAQSTMKRGGSEGSRMGEQLSPAGVGEDLGHQHL